LTATEVGIKATKDSLAEIVKAEPKRYRQAELGSVLGVSRQRIHVLVKRLNLSHLVRPKKWSFHCLDCGRPVPHGAIRCRACWLKIYGAKMVTLTCDFPKCGKQFERKESQAKRHKFHFCSTNCRNSYGAIYKWTAKLAKLVTLTCDFPKCGKQFERKESEARGHKKHFCSTSCRGDYARNYGFGAGKARVVVGKTMPNNNGVWHAHGEEIKQLVGQGVSMAEIGRRFGVSRERIRVLLKKHNLPNRAPMLVQKEVIASVRVMELRTKVFELYNEKYSGLVELARAMGIANSQIYRVKHGKRTISGKFIIGAIKAFPGYRLDDLFYVVPDGNEQVKNDRELIRR